MDGVRKVLNDDGIVHAENLYSGDEIATINAALDPHFAARAGEHRSYAYAADLEQLGILDGLLTEKLISSFFEVMDDPLVYHFHVYEIAARASVSHISEKDLSGWHRDIDSSYDAAAPSHVSLFVYLSDVGAQDGPFEFLNHVPQGRFRNGHAASSMTGTAGSAFYWNRYFYHRAAPNRGPVRRRVLKFSIQNNRYPSRTLKADYLSAVAAGMRVRDEPRRLLFGAYGDGGAAPVITRPASGIRYVPVAPNMTTHVDPLTILKSQVKDVVRPLRGKAKADLVPNYD